jgi:hypothetical protein
MSLPLLMTKYSMRHILISAITTKRNAINWLHNLALNNNMIKYINLRQMSPESNHAMEVREHVNRNFNSFLSYWPDVKVIESDAQPHFDWGTLYKEDENGDLTYVGSSCCSSDGGGITRSKHWGNGRAWWEH